MAVFATAVVILAGPSPAFAQQRTDTIVVGQAPIEGELDQRRDRNRRTGDVERVYRYVKATDTPERVDIRLTSTAFDPFLEVIWPDTTRRAWNDDYEYPDLSSRLVIELDTAGEYRFRVTSFLGRSTGRYRLTFSVAADSVPLSAVAMDFGGARRGESRPQRRACDAFGALPAQYDFAHPQFFVTVVERYQGHEVTLAQPVNVDGDTTKDALLRNRSARLLNGEVDLRSAIALRFDRAFLRRLGDALPELSVTVEAQVVSATGARDIEVPGYSEIGETRKRAGAQVRVPEVYALLCGLDEWLRLYGDSIGLVPADAARDRIRQHAFARSRSR
jgi:hypothetical protein